MEVKFYINNKGKLEQKSISLKDENFSHLTEAHRRLSSILMLEELFDQIIESHLDFKKELYSSALTRIGNTRIDYIANHEIRSRLNRLLFNTLNLSKLYLDKHYHKDNKKCFARELTGDLNVEDEIIKNRENIRENSKCYILGCELRRIAQHSTLPVSVMSHGSSRNNPSTKDEINAHFNLPIEKKKLIDYKVSKNKLSNFGDKIDLHEVMDEYIHKVSEMHDLNRLLTKDAMQTSKQIFESLWNDIVTEFGKIEFDVFLYDKEERLFSLDLCWFEVVEYLQAKHGFPINHRVIQHSTYLTEQQKTR